MTTGERHRQTSPGAGLGVAALALALLGIVAGCSAPAGSGASGHRIATLHTPSASASSPGAPTSPPPASGSTEELFAKYGPPPRDRLDETDDEAIANQKPYNDCLTDNAGTVKIPPSNQGGLRAVEETPEMAKAEAYCSPLQSLPPLEYDRKNPDALRFVQAVVDCLRSKGVKGASIAPDDGGGRWNIQFDDGGGLSYIPACEHAASAAMK